MACRTTWAVLAVCLTAGSASAQTTRVDWEATLEGGSIVSALSLSGTLGEFDSSSTELQDLEPIIEAQVGNQILPLFLGDTTEGTSFRFTNTDPANLAGELVGDDILFAAFLIGLTLRPPDVAILGTQGPGGFCRFAPTCTTTLTFVFTPLDPPDADGDGVADVDDNCVDVPNPDQADLDAGADDDASLAGVQHYGDACDADLDNDGDVGPADFFGVLRPCLGADLALAPACAAADFDGDDVVGASDFFSGLLPAFGTPPGPGTTD